MTTTSDGGSGSLRAAITAANASAEANLRIELGTGTYTLGSCRRDDDNIGGDLDITTNRPITIAAKAAGVVIRQTCAGERVLDHHGSGLLTLSGVTITGGNLSAQAAEVARGGGVRARGALRLQNATLRENSASGAPGLGAPAGGAVADGGAAEGGGVYAGSGLQAADSVIALNTATGGAAGAAPTSNGLASSGGSAAGGGAFVVGSIELTGGSLDQNRAIGSDGGIGQSSVGGGGFARGGGVAQGEPGAGPVNLSGVTLTGNVARGGASPYIAGNVYSGGAATGGAIAASHAVIASNLNASQNQAVGGSTGVLNCSGSFCFPTASYGSARGGALATTAGAEIRSSSFSENEVSSGGGVSGQIQIAGGAVWAHASLQVNGGAFTSNRVRAQVPVFGVTLPTDYVLGGALAGDA
ncbi:MAG TPA: hypothetical protein VK524_24720, partial [Polyangiaceae bacterium]|nr:hypothetical protein [Polyangiaceae bacterium]